MRMKIIIYVNFSDTANFEFSLEEAGIDFHKEEVPNYPRRYSSPTPGFYYYFKNKNIDKVDEIIKRLQITQPSLPGIDVSWKFESKVMLIVVAGILILIAYLYLSK